VSNSWDEELVRSLFLQIDAERILRIPLSPNLQGDFVAWNKTKNYAFSVRSAYHLEWDHQFGHTIRRRDGQGAAQINPVWEIMWKLNIPSKVKIFLWKALHGVLPGMAILADRHIKVAPQCPVCKLGPEDINHIMFSCKRAKEVWSELGLMEEIEQAMKVDRSGSVVLEHILRSPKKEIVDIGKVHSHEIIAVASWYIWWQRREFVKGEIVSPPKNTAFAISAITANYEAATSAQVVKEVIWKKPSKGMLKLNIDASYMVNGSGSAGAVLRNEKGEVLGGMACPLENLLCATTAEAYAMLKGLEFLDKFGCSSCIIESDSLELIQACTGEMDINGPYTAILADCFQKASEVMNIQFMHCNREANQVAHELARFAFSSKDILSWVDESPDFILPFVLRDVTLFTSL
jgi:ribonuclease HI